MKTLCKSHVHKGVLQRSYIRVSDDDAMQLVKGDDYDYAPKHKYKEQERSKDAD